MDQVRINRTRENLLKSYPSLRLPEKSFLIITTPRSGSTLLSVLLENSGCGRPIEAFNPNRNYRSRYPLGIDYSDAFAYINKAIEFQTVNHIMGMKFHRNQFHIFQENARRLLGLEEKEQTDPEVSEVFFPKARYIFLQRRNKIKQAISLSKALQNGIWNESAEQDQSYRKYVLPALYDREHIERCYDLLVAQDAAWLHYLESSGLPAIQLWFEDLIKDYSAKTKEVFDFLDFKSTEINKPPLRRQSNQESEVWEKRFFAQTPWLKDLQSDLAGNGLSSRIPPSESVAKKREQERWKVMPANRFKPVRKLFFNLKRNLKEILKIE
jgi:trehalose 2-sulfotransferase